MDMEYIRITKGLEDKGTLIPADDLHNAVKDFTKDHYRSIFKYNEQQYQDFLKSSTVAGIVDVRTNYLVFDFDSKENIDQAKKDTLELVSRLTSLGISRDQMLISFSGNKGFSVELDTTHSFTPSQYKNLAINLAHDLKTLDTKIYNASRIFRIPYTKHQDTGLYKIPVSIETLSEFTIDQIKALAKDPSNGADITQEYVTFPASVLEQANKVREVQVEVSSELDDIDYSQCHKSMPKCKYKIMHGGFPSGSRNNALMALGAHFKAQGTPKEVTHRILKGAAELQARRYKQEPFSSDEIWTKIISVLYSPNWKGATYSCAEQQWLKEICPTGGKCSGKHKESVTDVVEMSRSFTDFAVNLDKNLVKTGLKTLDDNIMLTTSMSVGLLGAPGSGKTSVALNVLSNAKESGATGLFCSLDMGKPIVFAKMAMNVSGYDNRKVIDIFKNNRKEADRIAELVKKKYGTFPITFKSGQSIPDIKELVIAQQEKRGEKIKLVVLDYLELIQGPYSDSTANSAYISAQIKDLSTDLETCVITLVQPQKSAGSADAPLLSMRKIKGASALEQNFRAVLAVYREGFSPTKPEDDKFMTINCLKNTLGGLFSVDYRWNGLKGDLTEMSEDDKVELEALRERIANVKSNDNSGWGD